MSYEGNSCIWKKLLIYSFVRIRYTASVTMWWSHGVKTDSLCQIHILMQLDKTSKTITILLWSNIFGSFRSAHRIQSEGVQLIVGRPPLNLVNLCFLSNRKKLLEISWNASVTSWVPLKDRPRGHSIDCTLLPHHTEIGIINEQS